eukprot:8302463-Lingulodinium_polyedra.AAC.1
MAQLADHPLQGPPRHHRLGQQEEAGLHKVQRLGAGKAQLVSAARQAPTLDLTAGRTVQGLLG